jgi:hypothetical protein
MSAAHTDEANARLIAAAHTLLQALRNLVDRIAEHERAGRDRLSRTSPWSEP